MHKFLAIFFLVLAAVGLYFNNEIGVFVGLALLPWQLGRIGFPQKAYKYVLILAALVGIGYFILIGWYTLLLAFIFVMIYNYWGYRRFSGLTESSADQEKEEQER